MCKEIINPWYTPPAILTHHRNTCKILMPVFSDGRDLSYPKEKIHMTQKLPIGIQSFEKIRTGNYIYVDKTEYIWNLVNSGSVYFLSRPRRFGKSLLISTMEAYFQGRKDLFAGLSIKEQEDEKGKDAWQRYPVIHFSLSGGEYNSENGLRKTLSLILSKYEEEYGSNPADYDLPNRFRLLIETAFKRTGRQAVVLVDEYDKPLLETMNVNKEQEEKNRQLYKSFFSVLKDEDRYLKFVFFTGVTKFSKISVFSDLNQLNDISLDDRYSGICGITMKEVLNDFQPEIERMANAQEQTKGECVRELESMYDGYRFSKKAVSVFNPFSLLSAFDKEDYGSYWYSTATPSFLIRKLRKSDFTLEEMTEGVQATEMDLMDYNADDPNPVPLFYQSGYLTIRSFDRRFRVYTLNFPNREVRYGFVNSLAPEILGNRETEKPLSLYRMTKDIERGDVKSFMDRLESLFAGIPYPEGNVSDYEREWRNQMYLIFTLLGQNVKEEVHCATGRADCIIETAACVYIFEFKLDKTAEEALDQIEEKGYAVPYKADSRKVIRIGVNFSSEKRNIGEWKATAHIHTEGKK